jgi:hypothetical protein
MTNVVEILITAKDLTGPAMANVNRKVEAAGAGMKTFHKTALLAGAGLAVIGVESVRMAAKFDASMTLLHTQAGVAQSKMAGLKSGVLALAGKVGQDPDSLAESLFHVESNFESMGISSQKALNLVETAAKGATVGHAKFVDVTNALTAAVASGIPGVQNMDQAMGVLNATVGVGDMKMQDLANAFGSGMVATVKGFGLNITDVGAALAVFGDNNIRGSLAGNQLRMSVMALAHPVATAGDALNKLGLTTQTPSPRTCRRAASSSPWRTSSTACTRPGSPRRSRADHHRGVRPEGWRRPEHPRRADGPAGVEVPGVGEGREELRAGVGGHAEDVRVPDEGAAGQLRRTDDQHRREDHPPLAVVRRPDAAAQDRDDRRHRRPRGHACRDRGRVGGHEGCGCGVDAVGGRREGRGRADGRL